jgi:hypothetical protein
VTPLLIYLLCVTDAAFAGFRDAAGRNGRIEKRAYHRHAALRGLAVGHAYVLTALAVMALLSLLSGHPAQTYANIEASFAATIWVFGSYATLVLLSFAPYLLGGIEARTLATVLVFGPMTLLRPLVIVLGGIVGVVLAPSLAGGITVALAVGLHLALHPVLELWRRRRPAERA